jgi:hypothetical protein
MLSKGKYFSYNTALKCQPITSSAAQPILVVKSALLDFICEQFKMIFKTKFYYKKVLPYKLI